MNSHTVVPVAVLVLGLLGFASDAVASPYRNSGWGYYQAFPLDNSGNANAVTGFVLSLEIDTEALINDGKLRSDGADLRFAVGDDECDYWIQKDLDTPNTIVWVRVPEVPADSIVDLKMYYDNPNATDEQDPEVVFLFWDDFSSGTVNPNNWNVFGIPSTSIVHNGYWEFTGSGNWDYFSSVDSFNVPIVVHYTAQAAGGSAGLSLTSGTSEQRYAFTRPSATLRNVYGSGLQTGMSMGANYPDVGAHVNVLREYRLRARVIGTQLHFEEYSNLTVGSFAAGPATLTHRSFSGIRVGGTSWNVGQVLQLHEIFVFADLATAPAIGASGGEQSTTAPRLSVPGAQTVVEGDALVFAGANAILVEDQLGGNDLLMELSVDFGTLTLGSTSGLISVSGDGTNQLALEGTDTAINAALDGLAFHSGMLPPNDATSLSIYVFNPTIGLDDTAAVAIEVTLINHSPTIDATSSSITVIRGESVQIGSAATLAVTLDDPDSLASDELDLTIQWNAQPLGTFSLATSAGLTLHAGEFEQAESLTVRGTLAALNAAIDGMTFQSTTTGVDAITFVLNDRGFHGAGGPQTATMVIPTAVAPTPEESDGCGTLPSRGTSANGLVALLLVLALAVTLLRVRGASFLSGVES